MADCHPILFLRMMDRVKAGAKLIVVDPRRTATAAKADLFLQIAPGTDLALLNGLLHLIIENERTDPDFIAEFTEGWEVMPSFLAQYPPDSVSAITGIPEADIRTAARWIGEATNWMSCWTMGLNQSTHGAWNTNTICNLHLATGAICKPGSGPFSLTGQPNAMGGREMGYMGPGLPGQRTAIDEDDRAFVEDQWGIPRGSLRTEAGGGTIEMFSRMADGQIKACWIICTNPVATVANRKTVLAGLGASELVIAQDAFLETETNPYADVLLPAALWTECEGVMINSERNLTLFQKALDPPGSALPDWQIIARSAAEMGYAESFDYSCAEDVFEEIKRFTNPKTGYDLRGISYESLRKNPIQWPCPPGSTNDRNPIRYLNDGVSQKQLIREDGSIPQLAFATASGRAVFFARPHLLPDEMPDDDYPFLLNTGRLAHQWHTMTKTGKVAKLNKLNPGPFIEIHPDDAARLQIVDDDRIEIASRRGRAVLPAVVTDRVRPGDCFAPFHWNDAFGEYLSINTVTNDAVDPTSQQPEFKACAVTLKKVAAATPPANTNLTDTRVAAPGLTGPASADVALTEEISLSQVDALAELLGRTDEFAPAFDLLERSYLAGLVTALRTEAGRRAPGVPTLPLSAPFEPGNRAWVDGVMAGLFSRSPVPGAGSMARPVVTAAAADPAPQRAPIVVLSASQTGNAEEFAAECAAQLGAAGLPVTLRAMDEFAVADLPTTRELLVITSTTGDGEPPDNGAALRAALTERFEIARITGDLVRFVQQRTGDDDLAELIKPQNKTALADWMWGRQPVDLLAQSPVTASLDEWLRVLKPLQPRLYSISSASIDNPREVHLTVSTVRYEFQGAPRGGVCSTYLADHADGDEIGIFVQKGHHFRPPTDPDTPMIMIGPGTGIAPFRSFLHRRRVLGHTAPNWLFFGERHAATDFYYRDEIEAMHTDGFLTELDLAFSRDQPEKVYVQDLMRQRGAEIWHWLQGGAHIYVCGDARLMAKEVERAIRNVVERHGGLDPEAARAYLRNLSSERRYQRDVY
jgi:sulfite reductase (NADPH) flavoprotein alpha-component